jgi:hypothetical protein
MCDQIDRLMRKNRTSVGRAIIRINNEARSPIERYKNYGSFLWHETAKKLRMLELKLPKHDQLVQQLMSRRLKFDASGKMWMESKPDMKARGVPRPDIADAFCMAFGQYPLQQKSYLPGDNEGGWAEIAQRHNWMYTGPEEEESAGRPGRGDDSGSAFGYLDSW